MVNLKLSQTRESRERGLATMPEGVPYWKYMPHHEKTKPRLIQQKIRGFIESVDERLPQVVDACKHIKEAITVQLNPS